MLNYLHVGCMGLWIDSVFQEKYGKNGTLRTEPSPMFLCSPFRRYGSSWEYSKAYPSQLSHSCGFWLFTVHHGISPHPFFTHSSHCAYSMSHANIHHLHSQPAQQISGILLPLTPRSHSTSGLFPNPCLTYNTLLTRRKRQNIGWLSTFSHTKINRLDAYL